MPFDGTATANVAEHDEVLDQLINVRNLLADPQHWTRNTLAITSNGRACNPRDDTAFSFCLIGAWVRHSTLSTKEVFAQTLGFADSSLMAHWNDFRDDHAALLARLDSAIKRRTPPNAA